MKALYNSAFSIFEQAKPGLFLVLRIWLGYVFLAEGLVKLEDMELTIKFFDSLGIWWPEKQAYFVTYAEILCGGFLILGLFTRFNALVLLPIIGVAIYIAFWPDLVRKLELLKISEFGLFIGLATVLIVGPGPFSLDRLIKLDN